MAHYRIGEELYDVDPTTWPNVEVSAVQRALGCSMNAFMDRLAEMDVDAVQAQIWTFRKRTEPSLRIGDVEFTLREYMAAIELTDQDVRDTWPLVDAVDREGFLTQITDDQKSRLFDAEGNLVPLDEPATEILTSS